MSEPYLWISDKLSDSGLFADDNAVAEENREGFVSDKGLSLEYRVTQALHLLLTDKADVRKLRDRFNLLEKLGLAALFEDLLKLGRAVKVVCDKTLSAVSDNENISDTCGDSLFNDVLYRGLVDDGEHFLGYVFSCGKNSGSEARGRDNCLGDFHNFLLR